MKIQFHPKDAGAVEAFLMRFIPEHPNQTQKLYMMAWSFDECDPIYLDCDASELINCFMELEKEGFVQSIKRIFQGDHFYRSDTGKCPRCWRHRPEIHWNNENIPECRAELCDRCENAIGDS